MGLEGPVPHLSQKVADALGPAQHVVDAGEAVGPVRGIVAEGQFLFDIDDGVDPEARQAPVQPPVDHFIDLLPNDRILPVEVRLFFVEDMEIEPVLVAGQLFPDGAAEIGPPVAGQDIAVGRGDGVFGAVRDGACGCYRICGESIP